MSGERGWRRFRGSLRGDEDSEEVVLEIEEQELVGLRPRIAMDRVENRSARSEGLGGQTGLHLLVRRPALLDFMPPSPSLVQTVGLGAVRALLFIQKTF